MTLKAGTLLVHWGQSGGGPRFLHELTLQSLQSMPGRTLVSYNASADISNKLSELTPDPLVVKTYRTALGVIGRLPRLVRSGLRLRSYIQEHKISRVVCAMESLHQSLAVPIFLPRDVEYVVIVHDAQSHPGEAHVLRRINRWLELRRADAVVALSTDAGRRLAGDPQVSVPVIPSRHPAYLGISRRGARQAPAPGDRVVVGFFGRLAEYKGLDLLVDVGRILDARGLQGVVEVHGAGPLGGAQFLTESALSLHVGWIDDDDVTGVVDRFDVLVLPYTEASQSGVIAQAMSLGVPCVVTPVGGLSEQVTESGCGVVASHVTSEAVAEAVEYLLAHPDAYAAASANGIRAAGSTYSWSRLVADVDMAFSAIRRR